LRLLCICCKKKNAKQADQVHVFFEQRGRHRIHPRERTYAKHHPLSITLYIFCVQEKTLWVQQQHLHAAAAAQRRQKKLAFFAYHRGKAIEIIIFYTLAGLLGKNHGCQKNLGA